ncbi:MAG TPA: serine/threonine-protein kinase, partial [Thermomonospora sp.]|nr:serine/threonine-protein kinase [Thermomonospora sp.]
MSIPSSVGRYRIDRVLGSGAFASVWLGHDDALAAPVAIKVLSGSLLDDLDVRNRFLEEARILRRADSERLVRVHDIGELPDGRPYFVMSYADRGTLADRMRQRPLPVAQALALAEEIAHGVQVINRLGVIHRDLKPSNVLFQSTPDGGEKLLIADLGLAKAIAHASGAFTLPVGTPGYMSPEQARFGGGLDVRADVYGLGALTYHMLTGKAPGPAPVKARPSELRPELTPEFDRVILKAMEVDRDNRWPTAEAFAQALATLRPSVPAVPAEPEPTTAPDVPRPSTGPGPRPEGGPSGYGEPSRGAPGYADAAGPGGAAGYREAAGPGRPADAGGAPGYERRAEPGAAAGHGQAAGPGRPADAAGAPGYEGHAEPGAAAGYGDAARPGRPAGAGGAPGYEGHAEPDAAAGYGDAAGAGRPAGAGGGP